MIAWRPLTLVFGPFVIIGASYWLTMTGAEETLAESPPQTQLEPSVSTERLPSGSSAALRLACERQAVQLRSRLEPFCRVIVRAPFVVGGDFTTAELDRHYRDTIVPTARALAVAYFDHQPDEPIAILLFSNRDSYLEHARRLDGQSNREYYGYYQRAERRIMVNTATGSGTLLHELTHALAHFDFPAMPEWFDEGLAALYEDARFSPDGFRIEGVSNWRLNELLAAMRQNRLNSLESLVMAGAVRSQHEAIDYAHARYFCFYLQERRLLSPFYRKFRAMQEYDPTGLTTLRDLFACETLDEVDRDFRRWLTTLPK